LSIAQHAVSAEPSSIKQRSRLASLIIQNGKNVEEALALLNGVNNLDYTGQLEAAFSALNIQAVAQSFNDNEDYNIDALCNAQRAIFMRPSDPRGWQTLAYVRARKSLKL
jgi:superkiller protein 3